MFVIGVGGEGAARGPHGIGFASSPLPDASASPPARQHWSPPRPDVPRGIGGDTSRPKVKKRSLCVQVGFPGLKTGPKRDPKVDKKRTLKWTGDVSKREPGLEPRMDPEVDQKWTRKWLGNGPKG